MLFSDMELYIIRHTQVDVEVGICYGQTDLNLANTYIEDLDLVKPRLPSEFDRIISSPLKRCTFIAEEFKGGYTTDNRLQEMNFGDWEMKKWSAIGESTLKEWAADLEHHTPPFGENLGLVYNRVQSFLDELRTQHHQKVLLVTHAGIIRCMWAYILQTPMQAIFKVPVGYNEIFKVVLGANATEDYILEKK